MNLEIWIAPYTFYINVTDYHYQAPMGPRADSDWDCYGYEEVSWECSCVEEELEDGSIVETTVDIDEYSEYIDEKVLEHIREMKDDFDYPEPDDYCYDGY